MRKIFLLYYLISLSSPQKAIAMYITQFFGFDFKYRPMLQSRYYKYLQQRKSFPSNSIKKSSFSSLSARLGIPVLEYKYVTFSPYFELCYFSHNYLGKIKPNIFQQCLYNGLKEQSSCLVTKQKLKEFRTGQSYI